MASTSTLSKMPTTTNTLDNNYDRLMKTVIVGDSGVGKSSCLFRYADGDQCRLDGILSTIGVDFRIVYRRVEDRLIKVQIWDTAGQERFRTISASYYRGADSLVLVYDASEMESVSNLERVWLPEIKKHKGSADLLASGNLLVMGNKCDLAEKLPSEERQAIREAAAQFADSLGARMVEVSAQTGHGIERGLNDFIGSCARSHAFVHKGKIAPKQKPSFDLESEAKTPWYGDCFKGLMSLMSKDNTRSAAAAESALFV